MPRKHFSTKERVRLFQLNDGRCHICSEKIKIGEAYDLEHIVPWELTRDDSDDNVKPAHKACHKQKTAEDVRGIRKADRIKAKHISAVEKKPFPGGKGSKWKRTMSGKVVLR